MKYVKYLLRLNYIRNHFLRFGVNGLVLYFKQIFSFLNNEIKFTHKEYKHPIYLRTKSSDIQVFYQILFNQEYDIQLEFKPEIIIDLGANIGLASIFFSNRFPNSKIIAIEAAKNNFEMLSKNTKEYSNIIAYHRAIWYENTDLTIKDNKLGEWGFLL